MLGIIGCGNMGEAILKGVLERKLFSTSQSFISDISKERLSYIREEYGVNITRSNKEVVEKASVILLAVKPQEMNSLLEEIKSEWREDKLAISIAAGIKISKILEKLGRAKVVRVMPNLCVKVKKGITAMASSSNVDERSKELARKVFSSIGEVVEVEERLMDAVTALSGSGPAYVFYFLESLMEAGVTLGFSPSLAYLLSFKTLEGAVELLKGGESPATLRKRITSKGGTTEKALKYLEEKKFKEIVKEALGKAYLRSKELSEKY